jgi:hypothetical protein
LVSAVVGYLILVRTDGNGVGWVLFGMTMSMAGAGLSVWAIDQGSVTAGALGGASWFLFLTSMGFLLLWFPTGRPPTRRWGWVTWLGALLALNSLSYAFAGEICVEEADPCAEFALNPIGVSWIPNPEYGPTSAFTFSLLAAFLILSVAALVVRAVRARGEERLQMKWLIIAGLVLAAGILSDGLPVPVIIGDLLFGLGVLGLPLAVGAAVLRYRLY